MATALTVAHQREVEVAAGRHLDTAVEHLMQSDECLALLGSDPALRLELLQAREIAKRVAARLTGSPTARPTLVVSERSWKQPPEHQRHKIA